MISGRADGLERKTESRATVARTEDELRRPSRIKRAMGYLLLKAAQIMRHAAPINSISIRGNATPLGTKNAAARKTSTNSRYHAVYLFSFGAAPGRSMSGAGIRTTFFDV